MQEGAPTGKVHSLITTMRLEELERYYPDQLSDGTAYRCALVRAFHFDGEIPLVDKPFQGPDYGICMEMLPMLLST